MLPTLLPKLGKHSSSRNWIKFFFIKVRWSHNDNVISGLQVSLKCWCPNFVTIILAEKESYKEGITSIFQVALNYSSNYFQLNWGILLIILSKNMWQQPLLKGSKEVLPKLRDAAIVTSLVDFIGRFHNLCLKGAKTFYQYLVILTWWFYQHLVPLKLFWSEKVSLFDPPVSKHHCEIFKIRIPIYTSEDLE